MSRKLNYCLTFLSKINKISIYEKQKVYKQEEKK